MQMMSAARAVGLPARLAGCVLVFAGIGKLVARGPYLAPVPLPGLPEHPEDVRVLDGARCSMGRSCRW